MSYSFTEKNQKLSNLSVCVCFVCVFQDAWSDNQGRVTLDTQQDYQLLGARQTPEGFSLLFRRPFNTCDPRDYLIEVRGTAFNNNPRTENANTISKQI